MKQRSTEATDIIESAETYMEDSDSAGITYPQPGYYAAGYYRSGGEELLWDYGLYNDTVNEENIFDVFSRIFHTVETMGNESKRI